MTDHEALRLLREWSDRGDGDRYFEIRCLESAETDHRWAVRLERESIGWSTEEVAFDELGRCVEFALKRAKGYGFP